MLPYILGLGEAIINDDGNLKDPSAFSSKLVSLKLQIDELVRYSFDDAVQFKKVVSKAFTQLLNAQTTIPSYIASYTHELLSNGFKGMSDENVSA